MLASLETGGIGSPNPGRFGKGGSSGKGGSLGRGGSKVLGAGGS